MMTRSRVRFITALLGMSARTRYEKAVCPSVRLSVKRVDCDKTEESSGRSRGFLYTVLELLTVIFDGCPTAIKLI